MKNQFEYTDEYMLEADYDMALMMKDDCIKQLIALRELRYIMISDEVERLKYVIRQNLHGAEADIHHYELVYGKPKSSLESTI